MTELTGTFVRDSYGDNNGTLLGDATWLKDSQWNAQVLSLDGDGDCVQIPGSETLRPQVLTISGWLWIDPTASGPQAVIGAHSAGSSTEPTWQLRVTDARELELSVTASVGGSGTATGGALTAETWHHVAGTWDGTRLLVYLDGSEVASTEFSGTLQMATTDVFIGCSEIAGTDYLKGRVADLRFYGLPLSSDDLMELQKAPHLLSRWVELNQQDDLIYDEIGAHHGSPAGNVSSASDATVGPFFGFDGIDDAIRISNHIGINPHHITLSIWLRAAPAAAFRQIFSKDNSALPGRAWQFSLKPDGRVSAIFFDPLGDKYGIETARTVVDSAWHHLAVTWDGAEVRIYLDGNLEGSREAISSIQQGQFNALFLGRSENVDPAYYLGDLANAQLYDRALSAEEVLALAQPAQ